MPFRDRVTFNVKILPLLKNALGFFFQCKVGRFCFENKVRSRRFTFAVGPAGVGPFGRLPKICPSWDATSDGFALQGGIIIPYAPRG